jgi:hypothetical protein
MSLSIAIKSPETARTCKHYHHARIKAVFFSCRPPLTFILSLFIFTRASVNFHRIDTSYVALSCKTIFSERIGIVPMLRVRVHRRQYLIGTGRPRHPSV